MLLLKRLTPQPQSKTLYGVRRVVRVFSCRMLPRPGCTTLGFAPRDLFQTSRDKDGTQSLPVETQMESIQVRKLLDLSFPIFLVYRPSAL